MCSINSCEVPKAYHKTEANSPRVASPRLTEEDAVTI